MNDELRRTGRTTRQLCECIGRARAGQIVVYVVGNHMMIEEIQRTIHRLCGAPDSAIISTRLVPEIRFGNSGKILITTLGSEGTAARGCRDVHTEFDHYVSECKATEKRGAFLAAVDQCIVANKNPWAMNEELRAVVEKFYPQA